MDYFSSVWDILNEGDRGLKFAKFEKFYHWYKSSEINFDTNELANELTTPSYASFCSFVPMRELDKKAKNQDKQKAFLHSIAHIEYSAIDIALDAAYRFRSLPREYYDDWLEVAEDEIRHFKMIENLLSKCGVKYGDMQVHDGLFVALVKTQFSLLERMAVLPRYMEANGLDANAHIIKKLAQNGENAELVEVLKVILKEEVSHVSKGDRWFKFACKMQGVSASEYVNIVRKMYPNSFANVRELNVADRLRAGFTQNEIDMIKGFAK